MTEIQCPNCGSVEWKAVEQFTALTPVRLSRTKDGSIEVEFDQRTELTREAETSVAILYICGEENCGHTVKPTDLGQLGGQP